MMNEQRLKIFMAEDDEHLGGCFKNIIKELGHELHFFADGRSAIEYLKRGEEAFDLAFIDFNMPGDKGDKVIRAMMESRQNFKMIYLFTGMPESDSQISAFIETMVTVENFSYLQKSPEELIRVLDMIAPGWRGKE